MSRNRAARMDGGSQWGRRGDRVSGEARARDDGLDRRDGGANDWRNADGGRRGRRDRRDRRDRNTT
ncbi:hypothetical protein EJ04DRAFT_509939 [Polyplosphaeria fusca]|uniref:Uncharacterized protein n=1 Tax=Polyplosphaeria fusca TaxID=682080 RepID=A0A9P4V4Q3_9PLEO|nr:hypothetical protein EJ04DRAFT_509939 [Polyplosphaeria fusca]